MVPDRDRRAIERKIFPAEVGILITDLRFLLMQSMTPLGQRKTDILPRTYDRKALLEGRRIKFISTVHDQGLRSDPNHGSGGCLLQYLDLALIAKDSLFVVTYVPSLRRNS